jgi:hypothetical protein
MDRRERLNDPEEATRAAQDGHQARIWTSLPGIIESFDADAQTAVVQPTIQGSQQLSDGSFKIVNMPLCEDVPVEFPSGGGCTLTFPVKKGDECTLDFQSRAIDAWWQNGGIQPQVEQRMHDLSDAICRVGVRSKPRKLAAISTTKTQLRNDAGDTYVELDPTAQVVNVVAPGGINLNGVTIDKDGNLDTPGTVTAGVGGADQVGLQTHKHPTAATGPASAPTPGT